MPIELVCPIERSALRRLPSAYVCPHCGRSYGIVDGVVRFINTNDDFYEGAYLNKTHFIPENENFINIWPLWLINGGYIWDIRSNLPAGSIIAELGCAGGVKYLGRRYKMVGCDLSLSSLRQVEGYDYRIQANPLKGLPLADSSVDAVVSSYFWEHISPVLKPVILKEMHRILRPNGKIIFLYDVETNNPLIKYFKKINLPLYNELFLEGDGHFGYQTPAENLELFRTSGFRILKHRGLEKTIFQSPSVYVKLANFAAVSRPIFFAAGKLRTRKLFYPYTLFLRLIDTLVSPFLPAEWARMDMTIGEKAQS